MTTNQSMTKKPIAALMYDFDKTLCTKDMQEYGFIPALGMEAETFWREVRDMTDREEMDNILAYMYLMVEKCREKRVPVTKESFHRLGAGVQFFDGVSTWFDRINQYGTSLGLTVEHYIVSSGIKEIIEGTPIASCFKKIYACEFLYDREGNIQWPKFAVNYTAKTQFLFRINKGVLTIDSKSTGELNQFTPEDDRRVPFRNMIYIGDGLTDVPCMKLVKTNGGQSIAVYDPEGEETAAQNLLGANRVNYVVPAEFGEGSRLDTITRAILRKIQAVEALQSYQRM